MLFRSACFPLFFPSGFVCVDKAISPRTGFLQTRDSMDRHLLEKQQKEALQATKEIVVKFIEVQRISPTNFAEMFPAIYRVVLSAVRESAEQLEAATREGDK